MTAMLDRSDLCLIAAAALIPRLLLVIFAPAMTGDWTVYQTVAENILNNHCVSLSDPASGACIPHWGGNQLPGLPWFIAAVWSVFPRDWMWVGIAQSLAIVFSTVYLAKNVAPLFPNRRWARAAGLLAALSPLVVPWARFSLPETLALAATQWIVAELVRSYLEGRLRVVPLAIASAIALFLRYDSALLAVPIASTGIVIHGPREALRRGLMLLLMTAVPLGIWWIRSIAVGLEPYPKPYSLQSGGAAPMGYIAWGKTWAVDQYQAPSWVYAVFTQRYSSINIAPDVYRSEAERRRVESLIAELKAGYNLKPFPSHIDDAFAEIAAKRRAAEPLQYWLVLPSRRAAALWFSPRNSAAWPVSLNTVRIEGLPSRSRLVEIALANPVATIVKLTTAAYRVALPLVALALLCRLWRQRRRRLEVWLLANALAYAAVSTIFHAALLMTEPRYVVATMPFLELALLASLARRGARDRNTAAVASP
ncbi:MAG: glycosyltransferase family 39 protein [Proteobacteria bacterium]|nr:glycosyltransferase family 39 protein [Pseudomonadota bacterium]